MNGSFQIRMELFPLQVSFLHYIISFKCPNYQLPSHSLLSLTYSVSYNLQHTYFVSIRIGPSEEDESWSLGKLWEDAKMYGGLFVDEMDEYLSGRNPHAKPEDILTEAKEFWENVKKCGGQMIEEIGDFLSGTKQIRREDACATKSY